MGTIEFYKAFIAVIDYVGDGHTLISASKGDELAAIAISILTLICQNSVISF